MSTANNNHHSRGKPGPSAPVIVVNDEGYSDTGKMLLRMFPAAFVSVVFHAGLLFLFFLLTPAQGAGPAKEETKEDQVVAADRVADEKKDPLLTVDVDPAASEPDTDIQYMVDRKADVSVPGSVNANEAVGIKDAAKDAPPVNLPAPGGLGTQGQGGPIATDVGPSTGLAVGEAGGPALRGMPLQGTFYGRSGATREMALRNGGGTTASEAAVARGLKWLIKVQLPTGQWVLEHPSFPDRGQVADDAHIAATAFGLLPLLAAGKTHRPAPDNPYDKPIDRALKYLLARQNRKTGFLGNGEKASTNEDHYAHAIATICLCESYGLTQDPMLRRPAQGAVNYIIMAQHAGGGWRYRMGEAGDLSVSGWMIMGLKSGLMAGLDVPVPALTKAQSFLQQSCNSANEGYAYTTDNTNATSPAMTAVGLLGRQYLQSWGPQNRRMITAIDNHLTKNPPTNNKNIYYYYYATQVMHHFGGEDWDKWNKAMREILVASQDGKESSPNFGSWSSEGDAWGRRGGRLMQTSLNLLTLEVYYRYLPLYSREAGAAKDGAVMKAIGP